MPIDNPEFDVAISFLAQDEQIAEGISRRLSETLRVFFFPENQKHLAGTDGMESMRRPFLEESRVMLVLYREQWGKTRWTSIEETAIKEACFNGQWNRLFFIALDRKSTLPKWLPPFYVRYNWEDFGLEQAIGAIKARALDNGGQAIELTPVRRAELLNAEEQYRFDKAMMDSPDGISRILAQVSEIFGEILRECDEVNALGTLQIEHGISRSGTDPQGCVLNSGRVGIVVIWQQQFRNQLEGSTLSIQEYNGILSLPGDQRSRIYSRQPKLIRETQFEPELSRSREYGWKKRGKNSRFMTSSAVARMSTMKLLDLVNDLAEGKIQSLF